MQNDNKPTDNYGNAHTAAEVAVPARDWNIAGVQATPPVHQLDGDKPSNDLQ